MAYPLRTRFAKDIVTEFLPPTRQGKRVRVMILADGAPGVPHNGALLEFLSKKGFWAFAPRYRGSWESGGTFLRRSPHEDVLAVIDGLPKGFVSIADKKKYKVKPDEVSVIGGSFGGPAALFASRDPRVKKVIAVSPVVDWRAPSRDEPLGWLEGFFHDAFGEGYRFGKKEWRKLASGRFYNPMREAASFDGGKILIFHAKDDGSIRFRDVAAFAKKTKASFVPLARGGHLSKGMVVRTRWKRIAKFLKEK